MSPYDDGWLYAVDPDELALESERPRWIRYDHAPLPAEVARAFGVPVAPAELEGNVTILQSAFRNIEERTAALARHADPGSPRA